MLTKVATVEECLDCRRPFSFYFDLIQRYWKASGSSSNNLPLHRICTLARKQDCSFITVECALWRPDILEELEALDQYCGGGGEAEALALSFFGGENTPAEIHSVAEDSIIGTTVVLNYKPKADTKFTTSYIYEAIIRPPLLVDFAGRAWPLLNNFVCRDAPFRRKIYGREFSLRAVYFCQQNGKTNVCAHASLRMAINSDGTAVPPISNVWINKQLNINPPFAGLEIGDMETVIKSASKCDPMIVDCNKLNKSDYLSVLTSFVQSGAIVLLVFSTPRIADHVVTVFGHTRNSDEWHPEAIAGYSGYRTSPYYTNSSWVDHFLIHDDNLGPYYMLSSRALEVDPSISARQIIAIHHHNATVRPHYAEGLAAMMLRRTLRSLGSLGQGRWFQYITSGDWQYVVRSILIDRATYQDHLRSSVGHDQSTFTHDEVELLNGIPEWVWMVEFSLPSLFSGNRSKLGEVLIATDSAGPSPMARMLGMRLPSLLILPAARGSFVARRMSMISHSPMYILRPHSHQW